MIMLYSALCCPLFFMFDEDLLDSDMDQRVYLREVSCFVPNVEC